MEIFVSWSGETARTIAEALQRFLRNVDSKLNCWVSTEIRNGSQWRNELNRRLNSVDAGIFCITPDNINSTWMAFEAGAIAMSSAQPEADRKRPCCPLFFNVDPNQLKGPFKGFQHAVCERDSIFNLVHSLNNQAGTAKIDESTLASNLDAHWKDLANVLTELSRTTSAKTFYTINEEVDYLRRGSSTIKVDVEVTPPFADVFFNGKLLKSKAPDGKHVVYVRKDDEHFTLSGSAISHFDYHHEFDVDQLSGSINLELERSIGADKSDWRKRVSGWLRGRRRQPENPVLSRAIASYLAMECRWSTNKECRQSNGNLASFAEKPLDAIASVATAAPHRCTWIQEAFCETEELVKSAPKWGLAYATASFVHSSVPGGTATNAADLERAITHARYCCELTPDHYVGYYNLACLYSLTNKHQECLDTLCKMRDVSEVRKSLLSHNENFLDDDFDNIKRSGHASDFNELVSELRDQSDLNGIRLPR